MGILWGFCGTSVLNALCYLSGRLVYGTLSVVCAATIRSLICNGKPNKPKPERVHFLVSGKSGGEGYLGGARQGWVTVVRML